MREKIRKVIKEIKRRNKKEKSENINKNWNYFQIILNQFLLNNIFFWFFLISSFGNSFFVSWKRKGKEAIESDRMIGPKDLTLNQMLLFVLFFSWDKIPFLSLLYVSDQAKENKCWRLKALRPTIMVPANVLFANAYIKENMKWEKSFNPWNYCLLLFIYFIIFSSFLLIVCKQL